MAASDRPLFIGYHAGSEQFASSELIEFAVAAERAGFDGVSVSDHFHPWQDNQGHAGHAWLTMAAIGQRTERLVMGTSVTCPIFRLHPAHVAHAFASLGVLYPGRVFLGLGTGEALNELSAGGGWGPYRERAERLVEAIQLIRRLWSEDWVDFDGKYFQVQGAKLYDKPATPVPIYVAASGPRSAGIAGREGDGWITDANTARSGDEVRESFLDGARAAGKDADAMARVVELWAVVGGQEDASAGARLWRFLPLFPEVVHVGDPREVQRRAEEGATLEQVMSGWVVSTDPKDHIAAIEALAERGVTHIFVHPPQMDQRRLIDFYGNEVLPALSRR